MQNGKNRAEQKGDIPVKRIIFRENSGSGNAPTVKALEKNPDKRCLFSQDIRPSWQVTGNG